MSAPVQLACHTYVQYHGLQVYIRNGMYDRHASAPDAFANVNAGSQKLFDARRDDC